MIFAVLAVLVFVSRVIHHVDTTKETLPKVLYVISNGDGMHLEASLTYINSSGGTQQEHFVGTGPFKIEVQRPSGSPVYMSAQLSDEYLDNIHVEILVDGKLLQEASSTGTYSIATASGKVQ
jgi:hypothetical protein